MTTPPTAELPGIDHPAEVKAAVQSVKTAIWAS